MVEEGFLLIIALLATVFVPDHARLRRAFFATRPVVGDGRCGSARPPAAALRAWPRRRPGLGALRGNARRPPEGRHGGTLPCLSFEGEPSPVLLVRHPATGFHSRAFARTGGPAKELALKYLAVLGLARVFAEAPARFVSGPPVLAARGFFFWVL